MVSKSWICLENKSIVDTRQACRHHPAYSVIINISINISININFYHHRHHYLSSLSASVITVKTYSSFPIFPIFSIWITSNYKAIILVPLLFRYECFDSINIQKSRTTRNWTVLSLHQRQSYSRELHIAPRSVPPKDISRPQGFVGSLRGGILRPSPGRGSHQSRGFVGEILSAWRRSGHVSLQSLAHGDPWRRSFQLSVCDLAPLPGPLSALSSLPCPRSCSLPAPLPNLALSPSPLSKPVLVLSPRSLARFRALASLPGPLSCLRIVSVLSGNRLSLSVC